MTTSPLRRPYEGFVVVELADDPSGEMTGLQFVNLGADVIKVEPPAGAPSRHVGPFVDDRPDTDGSLAFWYYNGGKRSVVLDLTAADGRVELQHLLAGADVFISAVHPTRLRQLDLDLAAIAADNDRLVVVSITDFGLTGPWAEYRSSRPGRIGHEWPADHVRLRRPLHPADPARAATRRSTPRPASPTRPRCSACCSAARTAGAD